MATGRVHGVTEPFSGKNWASWIQRLKFYFEAKDIKLEKKRRALLLTLCGPDTFDAACALVAPKTPAEVSFDDLVSLLQQHFDPTSSEHYSRYVFQQRNQLPYESISNYVETLKRLSAVCNFGVLPTTIAASTSSQEGTTSFVLSTNPSMLQLDVMLRDSFVSGVRN